MTQSTFPHRPDPASRTRCILALLPLAFTVACAGGDGRASTDVVTSDSAGITISEYPLDYLRDAPLALTEIVRIGSFDASPDQVLGFIAGGIILPDTSIVLADRGSSEVRRFARDGTLLARQGREGTGPGEYEYIRGASRCTPDGFTVFDINWTMNHYDTNGSFTGVRPILLEDLRSPYNLACRPDGMLAVLNWDMAGIQVGLHTASARLRLIGPDGMEVADLGERIGSERHGTPNGSGPHPVGRATHIGFLGSDLIVSDGSFFGFERWTDAGRLTDIVRIPVAPADMDSVMAEYLESLLAVARNDDQRRQARLHVQEMSALERATLVDEVFTADAGVLLREPSLEESGRWFAFEPDGEPIGWLPIPEGARMLDWTGDFVLVAEEDETGVPVGVLYRVDLLEGAD